MISHRERRRRLFAKESDSISHQDCERRMSEEGWETDDEEEEDEVEEQKKADPNVNVIQMDESSWMTVSEYRREWDVFWSGDYGSFEDTTRIPPMRYTHKPGVVRFPTTTLQLLSMKLAAATSGRLQLPLDVFGMVASRDPVDHNRNIVFQRTREDCQTITIEDPYLVLTGPTRAVLFIESNPVIIEVDLKVKGTNGSADECLSYRVAPVVCVKTMYSHLLNYAFTSKLSTLEVTFGHINSSVEATIFVRVIHGSWPDGLRGVFSSFTTGIYDGFVFPDRRIDGIGHERIVLHDSRGQKLPITAGDGEIKLSRRVVSVETSGKLIVRARALEGDDGEAVEKESRFHPLKAGSSVGALEFSFCKMEVTVFWSLISDH